MKDNIDAKGFPTTAACPAFEYNPENDATIVAYLRAAGAIVVGKTNLDQFATGLVGTRSPYGKTPSVFSDKHVSGGSSAGSGSVVGRGLVPIALGTDTAGSGRVPAALNNIIGLKPTRGSLSCKGVVPACKSLDCPSIFTLNLHDAQLVYSIVAQYDVEDEYSRPLPDKLLTSFSKTPVFAVPNEPLFFGDKYNPVIYQKALDRLTSLGVKIVPTDFSVLYKLANCLYEGPWVAERYDAIKEFVTSRKDEMDPVVYGIVKKAENFSAADAFHYEYIRQAILKQVDIEFSRYDGLVVPTCPLNPSFADIEDEPVLHNSRQGTYTNFVNLADMSALAIPGGFRPDGMTNGITLISKKFNDYALLNLAQRFLTVEPRQIGALKGVTAGEGDLLNPAIPVTSPAIIPLVVVGGHLSGMALNWQLQKVKATLAEKTSTSPNYRLYALPNTTPAKPGLRRVLPADTTLTGEKIAVEVWNVPSENFGTFISMVPHPLGIGSVELIDGRWVKGFICEQTGYAEAADITKYGGWRSYIAETTDASVKPFSTVLVANRGEIAVRIIKTLKKLGIKAVAVYSEPDRFSQHVLDADDAVSLNGTTAAETYLSIDKIIDAAKATGSQAIIPGYGFLSENADFAEACENSGIIFVGPSSDAIRSLGLKHSAREIAQKAGVPLVPGTGLIETIEEAKVAAEKIEYPLMIKSTAGGGGIGLQCVRDPKDLAKAFETVKHQGKAYFNDSGVFLERFVENARHVEIQVLGDGKGNAIALGERDCSLQRRNQKVVEETPAPNFPDATRTKMMTAAKLLVSSIHYKCAGTVEFIYDEARDEFYFLEVNARLQVEHPITESVTGLDLVEWMLFIAADRAPDFNQVITPKGASMEVRLYSENPVKDFLPSPGQITDIKFPENARIDTWVSKGTTISAEYDPTIAKIIVSGTDRADCLANLRKALDETVVYGVVTNLDYLRAIVNSEMFETAKVATKVLDSFTYTPLAVEITAPGSYTTVQDYPGRVKLWHIGVPPSGPMDAYAFRLANRIVGNDAKAPAIENTLVGPSVLFHCDTVIALTGGTSNATIDGNPVDFWKPIEVKAGQKLVIGKLSNGCRSYLAIRGGIDVPEYLGSRSTFALGTMGGFSGRCLKFGDVLFLGNPTVSSNTIPAPIASPAPVPTSIIPAPLLSDTKGPITWNVGVTVGPHGSPDFFTEASIAKFFDSEWKVHYNSNRFGVRLVGPKPEWARKDGGEAGLHPSNAHDYVYSLGAVNFTGDEPVILTCDGPSLGGFVCAAVVVEAEMWKIGQVKPGDLIKFVPITFDEAIELKKWQDKVIDGLVDTAPLTIVEDALIRSEIAKSSPVLYHHEASATFPKVVYRQAGDRYILVEYGENIMDLNLSYRVYKLTEAVFGNNTKGVVEMSPGVRSVLIEFNGLITGQQELLKTLIGYEESLKLVENWQVPSRIIKLPLAFEDKKTLNAVTRYQETIRSTAPWLPNNVDFIKEVNGLKDRNEVRDMLYRARFLVLGLGDVFLGAPCAVPLDPRHRLLGTKYNPSRTYTPNGTVGIGGMYMCIYTMESPGGYQLVGRTIPIWDKLTLGQQDRPWLLSQFDQVEYYPVTEAELDVYVEQVEHGKFVIEIEESVFDHGDYFEWVAENKESIDEFAARQLEGNEEISRLIQVSNAELQTSQVNKEDEISADQYAENAEFVYAEVAGRFWKNMVLPGDTIQKGQGVVIVEAMKTEMVVNATVSGKVVKIVHKNGDLVEAGDLVAIIEP